MREMEPLAGQDHLAASAQAVLRPTPPRQRAETMDADRALCGKPVSSLAIPNRPLPSEPPAGLFAPPHLSWNAVPTLPPRAHSGLQKRPDPSAHGACLVSCRLSRRPGRVPERRSRQTFQLTAWPGHSVRASVFPFSPEVGPPGSSKPRLLMDSGQLPPSAFNAFKEVEDSCAQITLVESTSRRPD